MAMPLIPSSHQHVLVPVKKFIKSDLSCFNSPETNSFMNRFSKITVFGREEVAE